MHFHYSSLLSCRPILNVGMAMEGNEKMLDWVWVEMGVRLSGVGMRGEYQCRCYGLRSLSSPSGGRQKIRSLPH